MVLNVLHPHLPAVHGVAAALQVIEPVVLGGMLLTAEGGMANQLAEKIDLLVESLVDGIDDVLLELWIETHAMASCCCCTARRADSGICHSLPGTAASRERV